MEQSKQPERMAEIASIARQTFEEIIIRQNGGRPVNYDGKQIQGYVSAETGYASVKDYGEIVIVNLPNKIELKFEASVQHISVRINQPTGEADFESFGNPNLALLQEEKDRLTNLITDGFAKNNQPKPVNS